MCSRYYTSTDTDLVHILEKHIAYAIYDGLVIETYPAQYHVYVSEKHYDIVKDDLLKNGFVCHS